MKRLLLTMAFALLSVAMYAQSSGVKGVVVSREGREAISGVKVTVEGTKFEVETNAAGEFIFDNLPAGEYTLLLEASEFESQQVHVRVYNTVKDLHQLALVPQLVGSIDDSVFAEFDTDAESSGDTGSLPSSLSASKDVFNNIASYRFSEMRFNVRGYDSPYQDVYLNGIRFNDAITGYGPWSLWSGLNDATRNQESTAGLQVSDVGLGNIGGTTNINARASQMRKGFRASVVNATQLYRFRVMLSYASGALDSGWSYGFSVSTRQGGNGYVDGVYYNAFAYFASVEKKWDSGHQLGLTFMGTPTQRGAQQASTQEAYDLFGDNYYNPNVGYQMDDLRNSRVRDMHEPIAMLNYKWQITENTSLSAATSMRFGKNGYSALTWWRGEDPRPDYYRKLPSFYGNKLARHMAVNALDDRLGKPHSYTDTDIETLRSQYKDALQRWNGRMDWDGMIQTNKQGVYDDEYGGRRSSTMIEERHTDQLDYNFVAQVNHLFRNGSELMGGVRLRINRTEYYSEVKDLLGGDYWLDIDKFAERDFGADAVAYQNNMAYYRQHGRAQAVREGDKYGYDYYAHVRQGQLWAMYKMQFGGFSANVGGEVGFSNIWREGLWEKGLFTTEAANGNIGKTSFGDSEKINQLTYKAKLNLKYQFNGSHSVEASATAMQNPTLFRDAFVSARTRNQLTPGLKPEKVLGVDVTYNLNAPWMKARLSAYYTEIKDQSKVISFYDDTQSSFTNFAMSGIDKRYMGVELGVNVPIAWGLSFVGAVSYGDYEYTSNPEFTQMIDNSASDVVNSKVNWKGMKIESTPQTAINAGLSFRSGSNWFINANLNYYDRLYLSMNPMYRTEYLANMIMATYDFANLETGRQRAEVVGKIEDIRRQEDLGDAFTLSASIGKTWYIKYKYQLGFSLELKNILNNQDIKTGGYEQMRLNRVTDKTIVMGPDNQYTTKDSMTTYSRFDSKYFYMFGTTYYLNVYFRF
ncbi:MAG: carboxypeptidase-like regulatory domain-containing protein [Alistipes sp.]|nr:carboxypeptidase-like regulatory domain-containing protein [Alistipes sp.]